jgi:FkbM family methyltransferase
MKKIFIHLISKISRFSPTWLKRSLYRLGAISTLIRRFLNRLAPIGFTEISISAGELAGMRMNLDLQTEKDYWLGTYEIDLQAAVRVLVQPGWVAYDVGANIGYITLLLSRFVGSDGMIFSFEALPDNLTRLQKSIALNSLTERVSVFAGAVSDKSHPVQFLVGPSGAMGKTVGSAGRTEGHSQTLDVAGIALDDFVFEAGHPLPQIIKMDIEGGEVLALKGMSRLLAEVRPLILLELHGHEAARVSWEILTVNNYQIGRMTAGFPPVHSLEELDWKSYLIAQPR